MIVRVCVLYLIIIIIIIIITIIKWEVWISSHYLGHDDVMKTFSALLVICAGNSPVRGEFPTQRPVTRSFNVFFLFAPE